MDEITVVSAELLKTQGYLANWKATTIALQNELDAKREENARLRDQLRILGRALQGQMEDIELALRFGRT